jgi:formiminotetrahydrofolate cyclodeaminase
MSSLLQQETIQAFLEKLSEKQPTPGGGASAAISASIGGATACMSAVYTQRKKDFESGAAGHAKQLIEAMDWPSLVVMADHDVKAYEDLQRTWKKDCALSEEEIKAIQSEALAVPTRLLEACHGRILAIHAFLPHCNPNITSDAKVGIHLLAGAARAAYQTVLVNKPPDEVKSTLVKLLLEIQQIETDLLMLTN